MGITLESFLDWNGFGPGTEFAKAPSPGQWDFSWPKNIKEGVRTDLSPVIPTVLPAPGADEWKVDISQLEWKMLAPV